MNDYSEILSAAQNLPLTQKQALLREIQIDIEINQSNANVPTNSAEEMSEIEENLQIVAETRGSVRGLDRETIIHFAENDEFCGY